MKISRFALACFFLSNAFSHSCSESSRQLARQLKKKMPKLYEHVLYDVSIKNTLQQDKKGCDLLRLDLKTYLLEKQEPEAYFFRFNIHNSYKKDTLFGAFMETIYATPLTLAVLNDLSAVLNVSDATFSNKILEKLNKSIAFKTYLWDKIQSKEIQCLYDFQDPALLPIQEIAREMDKRLHNWLIQTRTQASAKFFKTCPCFLRNIYRGVIVHGRLTPELALDIFRSCYYKHESLAHESLAYKPTSKDFTPNGYELALPRQSLDKLHACSIKMNAQLFPNISGDKRTVFSTLAKFLPGNLREFSFACKQLSREELKEAISDLQQSDKFLSWFLKRQKLLIETKKLITEKEQEPFLSEIIAIGTYEEMKYTALAVRLLKNL